MTRQEYEKIESYMLGHMRDAAHDAQHIYRVLHLALEIAEAEEAVDYDILIAACLLHDIGRAKQLADPTLCHAVEGGKMALDFLLDSGWEPSRAEHVRECVTAHRFRSAAAPGSIEAKILFDADKLDVTGAMGIARTLVFAGKTDVPIYSVKDGVILDGSEEIDSFFSEYQYKLKGLYGKFFTRQGEEIAAGRQESAVRFFDALCHELAQSEQGKGRLGAYLK